MEDGFCLHIASQHGLSRFRLGIQQVTSESRQVEVQDINISIDAGDMVRPDGQTSSGIKGLIYNIDLYERNSGKES